MLGETEENWRDCVEKTLALQPDSVTIYQMELPFNTTISRDLLKGTGQFAQTVATWPTKRRWVQEAFAALEAEGYHVASAYTAVRNPERTRFLYTDRVWQGDLQDRRGVVGCERGHRQNREMGDLQRCNRRDEVPLSRPTSRRAKSAMIRESCATQRGLGSTGYFTRRSGRWQSESYRAVSSIRPTAMDWPTGFGPLPREPCLRVTAARSILKPEHAGISTHDRRWTPPCVPVSESREFTRSIRRAWFIQEVLRYMKGK